MKAFSYLRHNLIKVLELLSVKYPGTYKEIWQIAKTREIFSSGTKRFHRFRQAFLCENFFKVAWNLVAADSSDAPIENGYFMDDIDEEEYWGSDVDEV